jgi:hypothetical protein
MSEPKKKTRPKIPPSDDTKLHVMYTERGDWVLLLSVNQRPAGSFKTQRAAVGEAKAVLRKAGGGKLLVHGRSGQVRSTTVRPARSPQRSRSEMSQR